MEPMYICYRRVQVRSSSLFFVMEVGNLRLAARKRCYLKNKRIVLG
jgi:hypothetical protein